jgi:hypothetical protein
MSKAVIAVDKSSNSKTGLVSATYAPIATCPTTCPFINKGCYAQSGHTGIHLSRMNKAVEELKDNSLVAIAKLEAEEMKKLKGVYPLRLHVVGDCRTAKAAEVLAQAAEEYMKKGSQPVWTYTHAWREIPRDKWGQISVLASCETIDECLQAMSRGYAASIIRLKKFDNSFLWDLHDVKQRIRMTPCKEMVKGIQCDKCRLCFNDKRLLGRKEIICFFAHGSKAKLVDEIISAKETLRTR